MRIGLLEEGFGLENAEPDVEDAVRFAIERLAELGASVSPVSLPEHREAGPMIWGLFAEAVAATLQGNANGYHWEGLYSPAMAIAFGEGLQAHGDAMPPQGKFELLLGTYLRQKYHGRFYATAQNLRKQLRAAYDGLFRSVDILVMPTTPMKAHLHDSRLSLHDRVITGWNMLGNTAQFNMTGHPSLSVPCGFSEGLPVGLMLTGRHFEDAGLLAAAHRLQSLTGDV